MERGPRSECIEMRLVRQRGVCVACSLGLGHGTHAPSFPQAVVSRIFLLHSILFSSYGDFDGGG